MLDYGYFGYEGMPCMYVRSAFLRRAVREGICLSDAGGVLDSLVRGVRGLSYGETLFLRASAIIVSREISDCGM